jgi:catechol 2,3-dioxygenase-like lactoylglutathione lyase family enzyme
MQKYLDHIAITVRDLAASVDFYSQVMGLAEVERHRLDGAGISRMVGKDEVELEVVRMVAPGTPDVRIDLQHYAAPASAETETKLGDIGNTHFCLAVQDLNEEHRRLSDLGVEFVSTPVTLGLDDESVTVVFMKDPDGYIIELHQA